MKYDVFISYSRKDKVKADSLCKAFDVAGVTYWIDRNIPGSANFLTEITSYIRNCKVVVFIASENSSKSEFTQKEILFALKHKKVIIPYRIGKFCFEDNHELDFIFSNVQWKDTELETLDALRVLGCVPTTIVENLHTERNQLHHQDKISAQPIMHESQRPRQSKLYSLFSKYPKFFCGIFILFIVITLWISLIVCEINGCFDKPTNIDSSRWDNYQTITVGDVSFDMVKVDAGSFEMGGHDYENPTHSVTITLDFYIGATEVTQALWKEVMGYYTPSNKIGDTYPAENISWDDCQKFIKELNRRTGKNFRLPTEAEWEFAARGGNKSKGFIYSGSSDIEKVAWYKENNTIIPLHSNHNHSHPVASKEPNELGLYDMSGNVSEWCSDWYWDEFYRNSSSQDPECTIRYGDHSRVFRGGGYLDWNCRVDERSNCDPSWGFMTYGLRLAL